MRSPSYDTAEYGVNPVDFREALELIIERGAVSHDALYSRFGDKTRATILLSVLEIKGLIAKPESSARWKINPTKRREACDTVGAIR